MDKGTAMIGNIITGDNQFYNCGINIYTVKSFYSRHHRTRWFIPCRVIVRKKLRSSCDFARRLIQGKKELGWERQVSFQELVSGRVQYDLENDDFSGKE